MAFLRRLFPPWTRRGRAQAAAFCAPVVPSFHFQLSNGIHVTLANDDIQEVEANVIVISSDARLTNDGSAATSLWKSGGSGYRHSFKRMKKSTSRVEGVLRCSGGDLGCSGVYHALIAQPYSPSREAEWGPHLRRLYDDICRMALEDGVESLAVVLIGCGKAGGPTRESVRAALEAFSRLPDPGCLTQLLLVERDERRTREAEDVCRAWALQPPPPPQPALPCSLSLPPTNATANNSGGKGQKSEAPETKAKRTTTLRDKLSSLFNLHRSTRHPPANAKPGNPGGKGNKSDPPQSKAQGNPVESKISPQPNPTKNSALPPTNATANNSGGKGNKSDPPQTKAQGKPLEDKISPQPNPAKNSPLPPTNATPGNPKGKGEKTNAPETKPQATLVDKMSPQLVSLLKSPPPTSDDTAGKSGGKGEKTDTSETKPQTTPLEKKASQPDPPQNPAPSPTDDTAGKSGGDGEKSDSREAKTQEDKFSPQPAPPQNPPTPPADDTHGNLGGDGEKSDNPESGRQATPLKELGAVGGDAGGDKEEASDVTNLAEPTPPVQPQPGDRGSDVTASKRRNRGQRIQFADL